MILNDKEIRIKLNTLEIELTKQRLIIADLEKKLQNSIPYEERLITLELWQKKLYELIIQKTPAGKETLSPLGRKVFGGKGQYLG